MECIKRRLLLKLFFIASYDITRLPIASFYPKNRRGGVAALSAIKCFIRTGFRFQQLLPNSVRITFYKRGWPSTVSLLQRYCRLILMNCRWTSKVWRALRNCPCRGRRARATWSGRCRGRISFIPDPSSIFQNFTNRKSPSRITDKVSWAFPEPKGWIPKEFVRDSKRATSRF